MKYGLKFYFEKPISLPVNYNKILQAAILNWIDGSDYSRYLHDEGIALNSRKYKLFTFSNIRGDYVFERKSRRITFEEEICLVLSFYTDESHKYILENIEKEKPIKIGDNYGAFVECAMAEEYYQSCIVDTISPITVHTTMRRSDEKKFTYYYEPMELGFREMITENLIHKIEAVNGKKPEEIAFSIRPCGNSKIKRVITNYGGLTVKAWSGRFEIKGGEEMIKMALLSGLGDRNSIGFGCVLQSELRDM